MRTSPKALRPAWVGLTSKPTLPLACPGLPPGREGCPPLAVAGRILCQTEPKGACSRAPAACRLVPPRGICRTCPCIGSAIGPAELCLYPAELCGDISPFEGARSPCFIIREICKLLLSLLSHIYIFKSQLIGKLQ